MKMNIYGCSHSTNCIGSDKWWGKLLSEKLGAECNIRSCGGWSINQILDQIINDVYDLKIKKNDIVILNTSYNTRYTVPHIYGTDNSWRPGFHKELSFPIINSINKQITTDKLIVNTYGITIGWYQKTILSYDLLSSVCDNVFQWLLESKRDIDFIYEMSKSKMENNELKGNIKHNDRLTYTEKSKNIKNQWKNSIPPPDGFECWDDVIKQNKISEDNLHANEIGNQIMYENFYNYIK